MRNTTAIDGPAPAHPLADGHMEGVGIKQACGGRLDGVSLLLG